jgi:hypothetical protein
LATNERDAADHGGGAAGAGEELERGVGLLPAPRLALQRAASSLLLVVLVKERKLYLIVVRRLPPVDFRVALPTDRE